MAARGATPCSLAALEQSVLGARRTGDVPGFEIPARYFQFVRSGDARPLVAVLEHNRLDLLSLAGLTARLLDLVRTGPGAARHAARGAGARARVRAVRPRRPCARGLSARSRLDVHVERRALRIDGLRAVAPLSVRAGPVVTMMPRRTGASCSSIPACPPHRGSRGERGARRASRASRARSAGGARHSRCGVWRPEPEHRAPDSGGPASAGED